ncbi:MAG: type VII secretion protein EccE [Mycobacterium sp.]
MKLTLIVVVLGAGILGWSVAGYIGAAAGIALALLLAVVPWRRQPVWSWIWLFLRRRRAIAWSEPVTVANDRAGGGVRFEDGRAIVAVHLLGKPHSPTLFTGSSATSTANTLDIADLAPLLHQSLGLTVESLSVVSAGARRRNSGDYPRVYDTLIGTPPYAGQRETWLVIRISALDNAESVQWRTTIGTTAIAAAQRICAALRCDGIRARVATATDIVELERRLGRSALGAHNQRWRTVRSDGGWLTTYRYDAGDLTAENLANAWSLRVDGVIQNITLYPDGTSTATITVCTAQPLTAPPSVRMGTLPGEQARAVAANLCGPTAELHALRRTKFPDSLVIPIASSGVLIGKVGGGNRMLLPLGDPGEFTRVHIAAEDTLAKRFVVRAAGAGERITVHTRNPVRWASVRMPHVTITKNVRPASGTTVSVVDGGLMPAPRPNTVISVGDPGAPFRGSADIVINQIGPATVEVEADDGSQTVEVELFRAENRYVSEEPMMLISAQYETVD